MQLCENKYYVNIEEIESVIHICTTRDKCCLSERRIVNLKTSVVWAICGNTLYKVHINPRQVKGIKYSYSLTKH